MRKELASCKQELQSEQASSGRVRTHTCVHTIAHSCTACMPGPQSMSRERLPDIPCAHVM